MGDTAVPSTGSVSVRDSVNFMWAIIWQSCDHTAVQRLRVNNALSKDRRIPMPPGWDVALNALKLADTAQDISQKSLPLNVRNLNCKLQSTWSEATP